MLGNSCFLTSTHPILTVLLTDSIFNSSYLELEPFSFISLPITYVTNMSFSTHQTRGEYASVSILSKAQYITELPFGY